MDKSKIPNAVLAFKLVGGQEIVAEVLETYHHDAKMVDGLVDNSAGPVTGWKVRRPHLLQFLPNGQGGVNLAFVPYTLSNPNIDSIDIPREAVLLSFTPSVNTEKQYLQQTSGLDLSTAQANLAAARISK